MFIWWQYISVTMSGVIRPSCHNVSTNGCAVFDACKRLYVGEESGGCPAERCTIFFCCSTCG